jgi:hypothetical protein
MMRPKFVALIADPGERALPGGPIGLLPASGQR